MVDLDFDVLIERNPKARRHGDSIRDTLKALNDLRSGGFAGKSGVAEIPVKGVRSAGDLPKQEGRFVSARNSK